MNNRIFVTNEADNALATKVIGELSDLATVQVVGEQFPYIIIIAPDVEVQRWAKSFPSGWASIDRSDDLFGSHFLRANISVQLFQAARN